MRDYENEISIEEISYELDLMMQAMLLFAGVKKEMLEDAVDLYIQSVDDVLENSDKEGVAEVEAVVDYMKKNYKELFKK